MEDQNIKREKPKLTNTCEELVPFLHRLFCECGRELELPQGVWHKQGVKWHYKCECGLQMQTNLIFPRIEYKLKYGVDVYGTGRGDEHEKRFSSSGHLIK